MKSFILKKLNKHSDKEAALLQAHKDFSIVAEDLVSDGKSSSNVWSAFAAFSEDLSLTKDNDGFLKLKNSIKNQKAIKTYIKSIEVEKAQDLEVEILAELFEVKDQNKDLIDIAKQSQEDLKANRADLKETRVELKETSLELKENEKKNKRSNFIYFAAGALISGALTFGPMALKKEDIPAQPVTLPQLKAVLQDRPKTVIMNYYFVKPIVSNDAKKKGTLPSTSKNEIPEFLKRRDIKVRPTPTLKAQP